MFYTDSVLNKNILLHACCGPCSLGAIEPLVGDGAHITLFYYNPCIVDGEYEKRLEALRKVAEHYRLPLIALPHDYAAFKRYAEANAAAPEGGARCSDCMSDRLKASARYARDNGFDAYTTTLTVSPHKNSKLIFALAEGISDGVPFVPRDFKKKNGFLLSTRKSVELGIYRQKFCGCEYSYVAAQNLSAAKGER